MAQSTNKSLDGLRVLVTRRREQAGSLCRLLQERGAQPVLLPAIDIRPLENARIERELARLQEYEWIALTSPNAARAFAKVLQWHGLSIENLSESPAIAVVGESTASAVRDAGGHVDLVATEPNASGLARALLATSTPKSVLVPGSSITRPELAQALRSAGVDVTTLPIYETIRPESAPPEALSALRAGGVDVVTFTSPSTVINMVEMASVEQLRRCVIVSIGPTTSDAIRRCGLTVAAEAREASMLGIVEAIERAIDDPSLKEAK